MILFSSGPQPMRETGLSTFLAILLLKQHSISSYIQCCPKGSLMQKIYQVLPPTPTDQLGGKSDNCSDLQQWQDRDGHQEQQFSCQNIFPLIGGWVATTSSQQWKYALKGLWSSGFPVKLHFKKVKFIGLNLARKPKNHIQLRMKIFCLIRGQVGILEECPRIV